MFTIPTLEQAQALALRHNLNLSRHPLFKRLTFHEHLTQLAEHCNELTELYWSTPAQRAKAIASSLALAEKFSTALGILSRNAGGHLIDDELLVYLRRFQERAQAVEVSVKPMGGRPPDLATKHLVFRLLQLYGAGTGKEKYSVPCLAFVTDAASLFCVELSPEWIIGVYREDQR